MFIDSDQFKDMISSGGFNSKEFVVEGNDLGQMGAERKDVYTALAPTLTSIGFGHTQFDPLVPRQFRKMRVRDLFSVAQTSSNLIDFFRVTGFSTDRLDLTTHASTVPEYESAAFGLKPQSSLNFEADQAPVRTIAHWEAAHRNVLQDEPQLRSVIDNELLYGLRLEEDYQILNGVGTGNDLKGLLKTDNIQLYSQGASATGETKLDALRRATTKVILANYEATGFVMHPYDWEDVELTRGADGHYVLVTNVAIGAQQQVWRQPVVDSAAMTAGAVPDRRVRSRRPVVRPHAGLDPGGRAARGLLHPQRRRDSGGGAARAGLQTSRVLRSRDSSRSPDQEVGQGIG